MVKIAPVVVSGLKRLLDGGAFVNRTHKNITSGLLTNQADVPVNKIEGGIWLARDGVLVNPRVGVHGLAMTVLLLHGRHLHHECNVILLKDGESLALHCSSDNTLEELIVEVNRVILL